MGNVESSRRLWRIQAGETPKLMAKVGIAEGETDEVLVFLIH